MGLANRQLDGWQTAGQVLADRQLPPTLALMTVYRNRHAEQAIRLALSDTRIVVVNGARQAGKSTVVHALVDARPRSLERRLDRASELQAARHDPTEFVRHDGLLIIDEVQRAPELILPIKAQVDRDNRPGQYLLTGSARLLGLRNLPDALVGRAETIELWPFSQGEIDARPDRFVDAVFGDTVRLQTDGTLTRADYLQRAVRGGFPEAIDRGGGRRSRFFESYVRDLIDRDVTQLGEIQRRDELSRLLRLLAARMATPLRIENVANELSISKSTVERYVALFEEVFLVKRIGAWSNSATSRATHTRKLLVVDSGLAAHLTGLTPDRLKRDPAYGGPLLENFVLGELARQLTWADTFARLYHYRTRDGQEVDAVLEHNDGRLVGIEVKASSTVTAEDFRHLVHLRDRTDERFHAGIVLYAGTDILSFGDRLIAAPADALWCTG